LERIEGLTLVILISRTNQTKHLTAVFFSFSVPYFC